MWMAYQAPCELLSGIVITLLHVPCHASQSLAGVAPACVCLLLLQRGGRVTYFGPLGVHSKALVDYLESVPGEEGLLRRAELC